MRRCFSPLVILLGLGSCRSAPVAPAALDAPSSEALWPTEPPPATALVPEAAPAPQAAPAPNGPRPYELVWTAKLDGWNNSVQITASGDPIFINSRKVSLLARHDGTVLEQADVGCLPSHNALFLYDAKTGVLGCDERIMELEMPGLNVRLAHSLPKGHRNDEINAFTAQVGGVAYGTRGGGVVVLERQPPGYAVTATWKVAGEVESLSLSPDLSTVVVGVNGQLGVDGKEAAFIEVYDAKTGALRRKSDPQKRSRVTAMQYSPDGAFVFADAGSFEAGIMDVATASWKRNYTVGSWVSSSVWLTPTLLAGAGSDGVSLFSFDRGGTRHLELPGVEHQPTMEGIGASADGSLVCAGTRRGLVACWSNRPVEPSTYRARP